MVGVIGNAQVINDRHNVQVVGRRNMLAVAEIAGALPLMFAGTPDITDIDALLGAVDGILLTGARANVHPTRFGVEPDPKHEPYDHERDEMALGLIEACVERGTPLFGICRGIQEMNVAFGGTLHQKVHEVATRMDHRPGPGTLEEKYAPRHLVFLSGELARIVGSTKILVNSLHGQAIDLPAPGLVVEAVAPDDTIEAVRVQGARTFAFGVQWHPEWCYADDSASLAIFRAFGAACTAYRAGLRRAA